MARFFTTAVVKNGRVRNSRRRGHFLAPVSRLLYFMSRSDSNPDTAAELRSVDRELLKVLRGKTWVGIGELTDALGVTATAVRQRVERLLQLGLIDRHKVVAGRGRPTFQYCLTVNGHRHAGANPTAIAEAMWLEILAIEDVEVRGRVIASIASRLGREYASQIDTNNGVDSVEQRMIKLSEMLSQRQIDNQVVGSGELPVLDLASCPYPSLTDTSEDRAMCRLEEQMISEALGQPVHLSSCRLDGDACCQFSATSDAVGTSQ